MTLQELKYIIAVSKTKHFGRAAEQCYISQPSLSVAVQKLEDELGVKLFERQKSKVLVTSVGEKIVLQAKQVLQAAEGVKQIAHQEQDPLSGTLKLGSIFTVAPYLLPYLVSKLGKLAPNLRLQLSEDFTENLREKLLEGAIDTALLAEPFDVKGLEKMSLFEESFLVLLPKNHLLAKKNFIASHELINESILLLGQGHCFRDHVLSACPHCVNNMSTTTFEGTSLETIRHMVASGMGITVLPATAATLPNYLKNTLVAVPLKSSQARRKIILVWREKFSQKIIIPLIKQALQQSVLQKNSMIHFL